MLGGLSLPLPALLLTYLPSIVCGVHAIRTGRNTMWLWLFIIGPGIGPLIYVIAELVPEWFGGRTANRVRAGPRQGAGAGPRIPHGEGRA